MFGGMRNIGQKKLNSRQDGANSVLPALLLVAKWQLAALENYFLILFL